MADNPQAPATTGAHAEAPVVVAEIERKFDVPADFRLPDLGGLPGVADVATPREHELDATYFDTVDLRLARNKITLRRRTGGDDAGWHLKRPRVDGDRDELRAPLGEDGGTVPDALRRVVAVHTRGHELAPVVRLTTHRTVHRLLDDAEAVLVEVAQDQVSAAVPEQDGHAARMEEWQELEVELVGGDRALLDAVVERMLAAGATASPSASKLARALGEPAQVRPPQAPAGVEPDSAGQVLLDHLGEHVGRLKTQDPRVRADEPDAVHQMRVACRRLRSALATFRPLLDRTVTDPLRDELQWLGLALGGARDTEVTLDHLRGLVEAQPPDLVLGPVLERITNTLQERYRAAHDEALVDLDSPRYFQLLDSLDQLVTEPPLTDQARHRADKTLLPLVAKTYRRVRSLVEAADAESDPHERDLQLHEVRKAAKRARYAGEAMAATHGKPAKEWASAMEAIQEVLGEHQDSVVIRAELLALAQAADGAGESAFSYGRLHALEEGRAAHTQTQFATAWKRARRKKVRRWLKG